MVLGGMVTAVVLWNASRRSGFNILPLPPGPKGLPIIGNLFDIPQGRAWLIYDDWFKLYGTLLHTYSRLIDDMLGPIISGDLVYFKVFGQGYLLLGSTTRTNDLFEKRSANYSDRPGLPMLVDL